MKLIELNPHWVGAGGAGIYDKDMNPTPKREGIGVSFDCPCGCALRGFVPFENPLDGGQKVGNGPHWTREGDTFETLTVKPSILRSKEKGGCGWHGFITAGEVA